MAAEQGRVIRIALVDDSVAVREMMRTVIEEEGGFAVVGEAANGLDGLELIAAEKPDAVLLDLAMPGFDGLKTIPKLRESTPDSEGPATHDSTGRCAR
jgi:YesN/AraC family two-component response regulator